MSRIYGFAPVAGSKSCVLILGSMPSEASLEKGEYYGHPRNAFWPLVSTLLGEPYNKDYTERKAMLLRHGVALWDVIEACEREGSGDAAIQQAAVNDFQSFYASYPYINRVFFNGATAYSLYKKHIGLRQAGFQYVTLGSTSPAHAVSFEQRMKDWQPLAVSIREETKS